MPCNQTSLPKPTWHESLLASIISYPLENSSILRPIDPLVSPIFNREIHRLNPGPFSSNRYVRPYPGVSCVPFKNSPKTHRQSKSSHPHGKSNNFLVGTPVPTRCFHPWFPPRGPVSSRTQKVSKKWLQDLATNLHTSAEKKSNHVGPIIRSIWDFSIFT